MPSEKLKQARHELIAMNKISTLLDSLPEDKQARTVAAAAIMLGVVDDCTVQLVLDRIRKR